MGCQYKRIRKSYSPLSAFQSPVPLGYSVMSLQVSFVPWFQNLWEEQFSTPSTKFLILINVPHGDLFPRVLSWNFLAKDVNLGLNIASAVNGARFKLIWNPLHHIPVPGRRFSHLCLRLQCLQLQCLRLRCLQVQCLQVRCLWLWCLWVRCLQLRCLQLRCLRLRCLRLWCLRFQCLRHKIFWNLAWHINTLNCNFQNVKQNLSNERRTLIYDVMDQNGIF